MAQRAQKIGTPADNMSRSGYREAGYPVFSGKKDKPLATESCPASEMSNGNVTGERFPR